MIQGWRKWFGDPLLPFGFVQVRVNSCCAWQELAVLCLISAPLSNYSALPKLNALSLVWWQIAGFNYGGTVNAADLRQAQLSGLKANGPGPVFMSTAIDTVRAEVSIVPELQ